MLRPVQFGTTYRSKKPVGSPESIEELGEWARELRQTKGIPAQRVLLYFTEGPEYAVLTNDDNDRALTAYNKALDRFEPRVSAPGKEPPSAEETEDETVLEALLKASYNKQDYIPEDFKGKSRPL